MKLKLSVVLLSSVLASVSFASDIAVTGGAISEQAASTQMEVFSKVVSDSFEGAGEYRARRAALESRLQSFQGQKLKVFTPEIFAGMLEEGIRIAELGLQIFKKLPTIAGQINERLTNLESRIKSKNALISWRELVSLGGELDSYPVNYWNEFKFDMSFALRSGELQSQVVAAHEYTLTNNERWRGVVRAWENISVCNMGEYVYKVDNNKVVFGKLVEHKFAEENDESLFRAVDFFRAKLSVRDIGIIFDISHKKFCNNNPKDAFEKWLREKVLNKSMVLFNDGIFRITDFVVKRDLLVEYVQEFSGLSEWIGFNEYASKLESTNFYEERLVNGEPLELKHGIEMQTVYQEFKTKVEICVQTALDETFEWLMTQ